MSEDLGMTIKYKLWNKEHKCWDQSFSLAVAHNGQIYNGGNLNITDQYEICASTNLHDKTGKEIFEFDLIEVNADEIFVGKVVYRKEVCAFEIERPGKGFGYYTLSNPEYLKIIGSIFENPELLEGGEK